MLRVPASPFRSSRLVVIFVVALLVAVLMLGAAGVAGLRTAFADGPGSLCQPNGPACTTRSNDAFVDLGRLVRLELSGCRIGTIEIWAFDARIYFLIRRGALCG